MSVKGISVRSFSFIAIVIWFVFLNALNVTGEPTEIGKVILRGDTNAVDAFLDKTVGDNRNDTKSNNNGS